MAARAQVVDLSQKLPDFTGSAASPGPASAGGDTRQEYSNYRALVERSIEVFGDDLKAALWLSTPSIDLDGKVPMQVAQELRYSGSELDRIFEPIFIRIEHGIYT